jgi:hypothetical protein
MSIFTTIWDDIKGFFIADVEPTLKAFLTQFDSEEGRMILSEAIAVAPALISGNFGTVAAQVLKDVISKSEAIAAQDVAVTLNQVQSALQIAKVAAAITTPGDQVLIAATPTPSPAPVAA